MGKLLKIIIHFISFLKVLIAFLAFVYFYVWALQFFDFSKFSEFNLFFGYFPALLDKFYSVEIYLLGHEATSGYIFFSGLLCVAFLMLTKLIKSLKFRQEHISAVEKELALKKMLEKRKKAKKVKKQSPKKGARYYALFEMHLVKMSDSTAFCSKEKRIKKEYSQLIIQKICEKYPEVEFFKSDKIFFTSEDFSKLSSLISDLKQIYKVFYELNNQKAISTRLSFAFWCNYKSKDIKLALKILKRINLQQNYNKIIFCEDMLAHFPDDMKNNIPITPLGALQLSGINKDKTDLNVELYYIK